MFKHIEGVIFDWAGTTVDYGCFAPVNVFVEIFKNIGIDVTMAEAREPMGMLKWDHIKAMLEMDRIQGLWVKQYKRPSNDKDVDELFESFEPQLLKVLSDYGTPIEHVVEIVNYLKKHDVKVGSTTGYNDKMIDIVSKVASSKGYQPESIVTPDSTEGQGRPKPYMIFKNMENLGLSAPWRVVKVGDTLSDVKEGYHAGAWSIGIVEGSSQVGLTKEDFEALNETERKSTVESAKKAFVDAGADFVVMNMSELPEVMKRIDKLLEAGKRPHAF